MAIIIPRKWARQPSISSDIRAEWRDIVQIAYDGIHLWTPAGIAVPAPQGTLTRVTGPKGGQSWSGSATGYVDFGAAYSQGTNDFSVLQISNQGGALGLTAAANGLGGSGPGFYMDYGYDFAAGATSVGKAAFRVINSGGSLVTTNSSGSTGLISGLNDGLEHVLLGRWKNSAGSIVLNADRLGHQQSCSGLSGTSITSGQNFMIHKRGTLFYTGISGAIMLFRGYLSDGRAQALLENPWQIYEKNTPKTYFLAGSGGPFVGQGLSQDSVLGTGAITVTGTFNGQGLTQDNVLGTGAVTITGSGTTFIGEPIVDEGESGTGALTISHVLAGDGLTQDNELGDGTLSAGASALTAEQSAWLHGIALLHGLVAASPLTVSASARSAGAVTQTIAEVGGTVTVTTTAAPSGAPGTSALNPQETQWLEDLARIYGLVDPLAVTSATRGDGTLSQTISEVSGTTTVTKV